MSSKKAPAYIEDGELIVGYNYGDNSRPEDLDGSYFPVLDTPECRRILSEEGFSDSDIDRVIAIGEQTFLAPTQAVKYTACEQNMLDEWASIGRCISFSHNILDYRSVIELGFEGLLEKVETYEKQNGSSSLYAAAKRICRAACGLGEKYAAIADKKLAEPGLTEERKKELCKIKEACSRVPRYPARNFLEAAQSL